MDLHDLTKRRFCPSSDLMASAIQKTVKVDRLGLARSLPKITVKMSRLMKEKAPVWEKSWLKKGSLQS